jgi:hypothetical protein
MTFIVVEHDRYARVAFDQIAHDAVIARIGELSHTHLTGDGESEVLDGLGDEAKMGRSCHGSDPTKGV